MNRSTIIFSTDVAPGAFEIALQLIRQGAFPESAFMAGLSPEALVRLTDSRAAEVSLRHHQVLQAVGMARPRPRLTPTRS
jgi:hypothetical protein